MTALDMQRNARHRLRMSSPAQPPKPSQLVPPLRLLLTDVQAHGQRAVPNRRYCNAIDALIPTAEARANSLAGPEPREGSPAWDVWACRWNRIFHMAMDAAASKAGLRRQSHQRRPRRPEGSAEPIETSLEVAEGTETVEVQQ